MDWMASVAKHSDECWYLEGIGEQLTRGQLHEIMSLDRIHVYFFYYSIFDTLIL